MISLSQPTCRRRGKENYKTASCGRSLYFTTGGIVTFLGAFSMNRHQIFHLSFPDCARISMKYRICYIILLSRLLSPQIQIRQQHFFYRLQQISICLPGLLPLPLSLRAFYHRAFPLFSTFTDHSIVQIFTPGISKINIDFFPQNTSLSNGSFHHLTSNCFYSFNSFPRFIVQ